MATTVLSWLNAIRTATLVAGSESTSLPANNLLIPKTGKVWRSLASTVTLTSTFLSATAIQVLALSLGKDSFDSALQAWVPQLGPADTVRHRLFDGASGTGTTLYDSGAVACGVQQYYRLHVTKLAASVNAKSWQCDIVATSRAGYGYFDVAGAFAAPIFSPVVGLARPLNFNWNDDAQSSLGQFSGGVFQGDGARYRSLDGTLDFLSSAEKISLESMAAYCGKMRNQALLIPDTAGDLAREPILGRFTDVIKITQDKDVAPPVYGAAFSIRQDL